MKTAYPDLNPDLTFHPVVCESPRRLTREQIDQYNEHGYLSNIPVHEGARMPEVQQFFQQSRRELTPPGLFQSFHHLVPELHDIVVNPILMEYLQVLTWSVLCCAEDPENHWQVHPRPSAREAVGTR